MKVVAEEQAGTETYGFETGWEEAVCAQNFEKPSSVQSSKEKVSVNVHCAM